MKSWPVFLWQIAPGAWSARLLCDTHRESGAGSDAESALAELARRLAAQAKTGRFTDDAPPDGEPSVIELSLTLRGERSGKGRSWATRDPIRLIVQAVAIEDASGRVAHLPVLGLAVRLLAGDDLKDAVTNRLRRFFSGDPPEDIAAYLPPTRWKLASVKVPQRRTAGQAEIDLGPLPQVAEPLLGGGRAWRREALVAELAGRLGRGNIAVVGEPGCGKSAVIAAAAKLMQRTAAQAADPPEQAAPARPPPRCWRTSAQRLIAGMRWLGEWEQRCQEVIRRLAAIDGVLVVDSLAELLAVGGEDEIDSVAAFLAPFMARGELRLVGECSALEFDAIRRRLPAFADACAVLSVPELADGDAATVVAQALNAAAASHGLTADPAAAATVHGLFKRHAGAAGFPGPAVRFIDELAGSIERSAAATIDPAAVRAAFTRHAGLAPRLIDDGIPVPLTEVVERLAGSVIAQDSAVEIAARVAILVKSGLADPRRPVASLLFAGPTGVGKTQLAKALAAELYPGLGEDALVRLDLSEYAGPDAAARMLGVAGRPSPFLARLRRQPGAVVLLDEIEKADPVVFDLLLTALDEGRVGDPLGRSTSLRQAVIVATTNLGADHRPIAGFTEARSVADTSVRAALAGHFRPEFLARIDQVVVFRALDRAAVRRIAALELAALARREGLTARGLSLTWDTAVIEALVERGYDPDRGARAMQRAVHDLVATPLATALLAAPGPVHLAWQSGSVSVRRG